MRKSPLILLLFLGTSKILAGDKAALVSAQTDAKSALRLAADKGQTEVAPFWKWIVDKNPFHDPIVPLKGRVAFVFDDLMIIGSNAARVRDKQERPIWDDPTDSYRRVSLFFKHGKLVGHCVLDEKSCAFPGEWKGDHRGMIVFGEQTVAVVDFDKNDAVAYPRFRI